MDDHYLELFSPDETLALDSVYVASHWKQCEAEKRLLIAVLKDAILDYKKYCYSSHRRFKEAESWIFGADTDRLFAFKNVCSMLNLSAERVRKDVRSFGTQALDRSSPPGTRGSA